MAITISGTDGIVGAGFTVDASGVSVTAGVGTFSSLNAAASGLTGALPAISGANLTNLPAANLTGTLPAISGANLTDITAGVTMADQWRVNTNSTGNKEPITSNWERVDTNYAKIGDGMTESSGVFTFPTTGIYHILHRCSWYYTGSDSFLSSRMDVSTESGSNYNMRSYAYNYLYNFSGTMYITTMGDFMLDVTNTSTTSVRMHALCGNSSTTLMADSNATFTGITFIRLGDT